MNSFVPVYHKSKYLSLLAGKKTQDKQFAKDWGKGGPSVRDEVQTYEDEICEFTAGHEFWYTSLH